MTDVAVRHVCDESRNEENLLVKVETGDNDDAGLAVTIDLVLVV